MNADEGFRNAPGDFPAAQKPAPAQPRPAAATGQAVVIGGALILFAATALTIVSGHRRGGGRRGASHASHARTPGRHGDGRAASPPPEIPADTGDRWIIGAPWLERPDRPRPDAERPEHADDYPSWPGRPGPYALHPDHPSWPGRPDPRWDATEAVLRADDYPSWPDPPAPAPPWRDAEPPMTEAQTPTPEAQTPTPVAQTSAPGVGWPGGADRSRGSPGGRGAVRGEAPARPDRGAGRPPPAGPRRPPGPGLQDRRGGVIDRVRPDVERNRSEPRQVWDAGSVELASWIISEANQQATEIRHEARDDAAASLAEAKQEAAKLMQQAADQAAATLAAAELQATEIRAGVMKLSTELNGVAAYIAENLLTQTPPTTRPAIKPVRPPADRPAAEPVSEPGVTLTAQPAAQTAVKLKARPGAGRAAKSGTAAAPKPARATTHEVHPAALPKSRSRQLVAMRVGVIATTTLCLFALITGTTEVALHGFKFFVFRSVGAGETGPNGLQEDQGPGQPDAPGVHHQLPK